MLRGHMRAKVSQCPSHFSVLSVLKFEKLNTKNIEKTGSSTEINRNQSILSVHKDEGDLAGDLSAIDPCVVGASLHDDVARL
jgi:hypothetical protein